MASLPPLQSTMTRDMGKIPQRKEGSCYPECGQLAKQYGVRHKNTGPRAGACGSD
ncbi:hypothetical protein JUNP479_1166 [Aeromonas jandaei]|nr:hypothetical protein JUNP479_1166 [Aeromonas jandaei]